MDNQYVTKTMINCIIPYSHGSPRAAATTVSGEMYTAVGTYISPSR